MALLIMKSVIFYFHDFFCGDVCFIFMPIKIIGRFDNNGENSRRSQFNAVDLSSHFEKVNKHFLLLEINQLSISQFI